MPVLAANVGWGTLTDHQTSVFNSPLRRAFGGTVPVECLETGIPKPKLCGSFALTHIVSGGATTFTVMEIVPAAATVPAQGTVTVTATSNADSSKSNSVTFPIANPGQVDLLTGQYVCSISGTNGPGAYAALGSVTLDGKGNVTAGEEDYVDINISLARVALVSTGSSYTTGSNGLGTMTLNWETFVIAKFCGDRLRREAYV